jgi:hypothetical protein
MLTNFTAAKIGDEKFQMAILPKKNILGQLFGSVEGVDVINTS